LQDGKFLHTFAHICGKPDRMFIKILHWTKKSPLHSESHADSDPDTGFGADPPWRRSALMQCAVLVLLFVSKICSKINITEN